MTKEAVRFVLRDDQIVVRCEQYIESVADSGKLYEVLVRPYRKNRTVQQNNYYFGVIIKLMCEETGYTKEEMHWMLCRKLLGVSEIADPESGEMHQIVNGTSGLSTTEFSDYMEAVMLWGQQFLHINFPPPTYFGMEW